MRDKKGLSAIVTTLIIILLVLVAIGIVWAVVRNLIGTGSESVDYNAKCLAIDVRATKLVCGDANCDVTLSRTGSGNDAIKGVKLVFKNAAGATTTAPIVKEGNVPALVPTKYLEVPSGISDPNEVHVTVYFEDASGVDKNCDTQTTTYKIT